MVYYCGTAQQSDTERNKAKVHKSFHVVYYTKYIYLFALFLSLFASSKRLLDPLGHEKEMVFRMKAL